MNKKSTFLQICLFFVIFLTLISVPLCGYPQPTKEKYVNDFANLINPADHKQIYVMLKELEFKTGIQVVVVTIKSVSYYNTGYTTLESFATGLFNNWGIGRKNENNGVLLIVSVDDRRCRIELGGSYGHRYDATMKEVIDKQMIPYFQQNDFSRGIYEGTRAIIEKITVKVTWLSYYKWQIIIGVLIIIFAAAGINFIKNGKKGWGWTFLAVAGFLLILLIRILTLGKSSGGFGGRKSFGGGASGSW